MNFQIISFTSAEFLFFQRNKIVSVPNFRTKINIKFASSYHCETSQNKTLIKISNKKIDYIQSNFSQTTKTFSKTI